MMEVGCSLGLQFAESGILEESDITGDCDGDKLELDTTSDEVGQLLLAIQQGNRGHGCGKSDTLTPGLDFELSNSDMGPHSDFSMDHASVFDISESVLEDKTENSYLFGDVQLHNCTSNVQFHLDPTDKSTQNVNAVERAAANQHVLSVSPESLLNVRLIPLNNIHVLSTVPTNSGVSATSADVPSTTIGNVIPSAVLLSNIVSLYQGQNCDLFNGQTLNLVDLNLTSLGSTCSPSSTASSLLPCITTASCSGENITAKSQFVQSDSIDQDCNTETSLVSLGEHLTMSDCVADKQNQVSARQAALSGHSLSTADLSSVSQSTDVAEHESGKGQQSVSQAGVVDKRLVQASQTHRPGIVTNRVGNRKMVSLLNNAVKNKFLQKTFKVKQYRSSDTAQQQNKSPPTPKPIPVTFQLETEDGIKMIPAESVTLVSSDGSNGLSKHLTGGFEQLVVQTCHPTDKIVTTRLDPENTVTNRLDPDSGISSTNEPEKTLQAGSARSQKEAHNENVTVCAKSDNPKQLNNLPSSMCTATFNGVRPVRCHERLQKKRSAGDSGESSVKDITTKKKTRCRKPRANNITKDVKASSPRKKNSQLQDLQVEVTSMSINESEAIVTEEKSQTSPSRAGTVPDGSMAGGDEVVTLKNVLSEKSGLLGFTDNVTRTEPVTKSERRFKCELCTAAFTTLGNLTRHHMTHAVKSPEDYRFRCDVCERRFLQNCDLKRHQLIHSSQFPYKCEICGKGYIRNSDLTVHRRFHRKEKSFKCSWCIKSFYQSGDLHRHTRHFHVQAAKLTCGHCSRQYAKESTLIQHMQSKHRDLITSCLRSETQPRQSEVPGEAEGGTSEGHSVSFEGHTNTDHDLSAKTLLEQQNAEEGDRVGNRLPESKKQSDNSDDLLLEEKGNSLDKECDSQLEDICDMIESESQSQES